MKRLNWYSSETEILLNPALAEEERHRIEKGLSQHPLQSHVWLTTSGSTASSQERKLAALSKEAILASAKAVNDHLQSDKKDIWLNVLPCFHVGGLGVFARAFLSGAKVIDVGATRWNPLLFYQFLNDDFVTLTSLVPAQVFDLVSRKLAAPKCLRAIIVGGGALSQVLYEEARTLGWKLLPSYGMTESASQIATAELNHHSPNLKVLSHMELKVDEESFICLKGPSLLTVYASISQEKSSFWDPKREGWLKTQDRGVCHGSYLEVHGRQGDFIKIGGESVNLNQLEQILSEVKLQLSTEIEAVLTTAPDSRLGHVIILVTTSQHESSANKVMATFNSRVMGFERIRRLVLLPKIPRSPLGKPLYGPLQTLISLQS